MSCDTYARAASFHSYSTDYRNSELRQNTNKDWLLWAMMDERPQDELPRNALPTEWGE